MIPLSRRVVFLCLGLASSALAVAGDTPFVHARFVPERKDDFAWENDLVAFRAYGPALKAGPEDSGIDCWLKRVHYPIIDNWYASGDYHVDHGEGLDPYHVGSSRGCGGIALVMRDGTFKTSHPFTAWRIIEAGPTRAIFELDYRYDGTAITETKRITIEPGSQLFHAESRFLENGKPRAFDVAIGITTHDGAAAVRFDSNAGWMACWEKFAKDGELGTGVILPGATFKEIKSATKDASHVWAFTKTNAEGKVDWLAGFGWSKAGAIPSFEVWTDYLRKAAIRKRVNP